jgi:LPXTG-motif cell wall-anchored protein
MYGSQLPTTGFSGLIYAVVGLVLIAVGLLIAGARRLIGVFR